MDSAELLDLLGNANRRRILRLLAHKPCYVTEISEYIGVSPKAVIDHLDRLEEAGLVESRTDDRRRKYFSIARNVRLEVQVSPYEFGTKSAYPASSGLDVNSCRYLSIEVTPSGGDGLDELARELRRLEELDTELSMAQRWVQGKLTEVRERIGEAVGDENDGRLYAEIVGELGTEPRTASTLARRLDAPTSVVEEALEALTEEGVVEERTEGWTLRDRA